MRFSPASIEGAWILDIQPQEDGRGFFARSWCDEEASERGIVTGFVQQSLAYNRSQGTLRGLHYQQGQHDEDKLIRCVSGAIFDVIVDLRSDSPTFAQWFSVELSAVNRRSLYVPRGLAHGYLTLCDDSELLYQMTTPYEPGVSFGLRWDDPDLGIDWPLTGDPVISDRDRILPFFSEVFER